MREWKEAGPDGTFETRFEYLSTGEFARIEEKAYQVGWSGLTAEEQRTILLWDRWYVTDSDGGTFFNDKWFVHGHDRWAKTPPPPEYPSWYRLG